MEETQYCVVLREGKDAGTRQYFWASKKGIQAIFKTCSFNKGNYGTEHVVDLQHVVYEGKPEDIKKSKKLAKVHFIERKIGSLEFHVDTKEDLIKCLKYFNIK